MKLEHNSRKDIYRMPFGAVPCETKIRLRIAVESAGIPERAVCIVNGTEALMHYCFDMNGTRIYECDITSGGESGLIFYYFIITADGETVFYGNNENHLGGDGQIYSSEPESKYQITVYERGYETPDWMKNAVVYQIFPDRFYNKNSNISHGIKRSWNEEPFYTAAQFGGEYLSNDFFGGTLSGIEEKLPYLKKLGVSVIYLNPIFKSFSNHRYDTSDYETIDENLGTNEDFASLASAAEKMGIRLILDGVFSHTGADSKYFNKYGHFDSIGAYQSKDSPYYSWYNFKNFPDDYDSWWGFETLPNVNELDEKYLDYIVRGKNAVAKLWLRRGASGWRLDVADELPDEFIAEFRKSIKSEKSDSMLIGEVWEDASNKISYGKRRRFLWGNGLDSVMNYVFRTAVCDYLVGEDSSLFTERICSMLENYPPQSLYTAMNLISSHDVPRAMTVFSGAPDFRTMDRAAQHDYFMPHDSWCLALKRMVLAIAIQMTMPGAPCIYYGDEAGMCGYADPFNRMTFPWGHENAMLADQTEKLAAFRNAHQCLRTGSFEMLYYVGAACCYMRSIKQNDVFGKAFPDESIVVLINASQNESAHMFLDLARFGAASMTDVFSGEKAEYNCGIEIDAPALSYRIFILERKKTECTKIQSIR